MAGSRAFLTFNKELQVPEVLETLVKKVFEENDINALSKLPLQHQWTVWEQIESESQKDYTNSMKPICRFSTVKKFWKLWDLLPQPSQLMGDRRMVRDTGEGPPQMVDAIMIFRDNVKPMWEDPLNAAGGHFEIRYQQTIDDDSQMRLDEHWNNIVLGMIGSTLEPVGMITGVRLVDKLHASGRGGGFIRIEVWFTDTGVADGRHILKSSLEKALTTHLDGTQDSTRVNMSLKLHQKANK